MIIKLHLLFKFSGNNSNKPVKQDFQKCPSIAQPGSLSLSLSLSTRVPLITDPPPSNSTILRDAGTSQNTKKCPKDTFHKF